MKLVFGFLILFCSGNAMAVVDPTIVNNDKVILIHDSPLLSRLQILKASEDPTKSRSLLSVGQILASANPSGELTGSKLAWVELDEEVSKSMGIHPQSLKNAKIGDAYGMTVVEPEYSGKIHVGEKIKVFQYGLKKSETTAVVTGVRKSPKNDGSDENDLKVIFKLSGGQAWFPGTNCQVTFPMIQHHPIRVPTSALLHEGLREYLVQEVSPGHFSTRGVTIVDSGEDSVLVIGDVKPGDRIVGQGAILLKPLLHHLIAQDDKIILHDL
jgi:hypothetical protein